jgi:hypothetical protein
MAPVYNQEIDRAVFDALSQVNTMSNGQLKRDVLNDSEGGTYTQWMINFFRRGTISERWKRIEEATPNEIDKPKELFNNKSINDREISKTLGIVKASRILGIIVGIWTAIVLVDIIDYNFRLSNIRANTSGLGTLFAERLAPSIEIGTMVAFLFVIITIVLIIHTSRSRVVAVAILSTINLILTLWIISQIPNILNELFVILSIGIIFNIAVMIFAVAAYKKMA